MPSTFTHIAAGAAAGYILKGPKKDYRFLLFAIICSVLPDVDVLAFRLGIPYEHVFGHRGFMHSIGFAFIISSLMTYIWSIGQKAGMLKKTAVFISLLFIMVLHSLLDAMTSGGLGIGFFIPLDNTRYFLPARPIKVSPISLNAFMSKRGIEVLRSEFYTVWIPCIALLIINFAAGKIISFIKRSSVFCNAVEDEPVEKTVSLCVEPAKVIETTGTNRETP